MKKSFATLAAVLVMLCITSTALAETPVLSSNEGIKITVCNPPKLYYSGANGETYAPMIKLAASNVEVFESMEVLIFVEFIGTPAPGVELKYNGDNKDFLKDMSRYGMSNGWDGSVYYSRFWIIAAKTEDSGVYTFRIYNSRGSVSSSAKVKVNVKPNP